MFGCWLKNNKIKEGAPKGCHHKAVVQCRGQRGDPEQALGVLRALKII